MLEKVREESVKVKKKGGGTKGGLQAGPVMDPFSSRKSWSEKARCLKKSQGKPGESCNEVPLPSFLGSARTGSKELGVASMPSRSMILCGHWRN